MQIKTDLICNSSASTWLESVIHDDSLILECYENFCRNYKFWYKA